MAPRARQQVVRGVRLAAARQRRDERERHARLGPEAVVRRRPPDAPRAPVVPRRPAGEQAERVRVRRRRARRAAGPEPPLRPRRVRAAGLDGQGPGPGPEGDLPLPGPLHEAAGRVCVELARARGDRRRVARVVGQAPRLHVVDEHERVADAAARRAALQQRRQQVHLVLLRAPVDAARAVETARPQHAVALRVAQEAPGVVQVQAPPRRERRSVRAVRERVGPVPRHAAVRVPPPGVPELVRAPRAVPRQPTGLERRRAREAVRRVQVRGRRVRVVDAEEGLPVPGLAAAGHGRLEAARVAALGGHGLGRPAVPAGPLDVARERRVARRLGQGPQPRVPRPRVLLERRRRVERERVVAAARARERVDDDGVVHDVAAPGHGAERRQARVGVADAREAVEEDAPAPVVGLVVPPQGAPLATQAGGVARLRAAPQVLVALADLRRLRRRRRGARADRLPRGRRRVSRRAPRRHGRRAAPRGPRLRGADAEER